MLRVSPGCFSKAVEERAKHLRQKQAPSNGVAHVSSSTRQEVPYIVGFRLMIEILFKLMHCVLAELRKSKM